MQEQRNKRLLISLVVLAVATYVVFWFTSKEETFAIDKGLFLVEDLESINRVTLETEAGKIEIAFNGSRWKVNGAFDADPNLVKVLFATLKQAAPRRPVSPSIKDSLALVLQKFGTEVTLYQGDEVRGSFVAGGNAQKTQAYFQEKGSGDIYIMGIPGYRVYVSGIFELNEGGWRDKTIFNFHWQNFRSLELQYPGRPADGFAVGLSEDNIFGVKGIARTDTVKLSGYMDRIFALEAEEIIYSVQYADSLQKIVPEAILTVTDIADRQYRLSIFSANSDFIPALLNDNQAFNINRRRLQPLLRKRSFFVPQ